MSKTTGTAEQILSLPKGGGAVQGLGTTFETDLNTGTGSYSIPINVPSGPNGNQPRIVVRYHSAQGNGPLGLGWTMGLLAIARKTEGRIPNYGPDDDEFVLLGVEDLVPVGNSRYRPLVDTMHWRIERQGAGWELTDTQGVRHRLGLTPQARVETVEDGLVKTAMWLLESVEDPNGNATRYFYRQEGAQRYLERVEWGTYALEFFYEDRPDPLGTGRYGFLLETTLRCTRIELHVLDVAPSLARSWSLEYAQAPGSALSLLRHVTLRGHAADAGTTKAPPLTFEYSKFEPRDLEAMRGTEPGFVPGTFGDGRRELIDWNGNGLPDLLELGGGHARIWPNLGRGRWGTPRSLPRLPAPVTLDEPGVAFADMDGNGTADLILLDRPLTGFYPHLPGGGFDRPVYWRQAPSVRLADRNARLVDLDGDGITDLLVTGDRYFLLYYRDGSDGWAPQPQTVPRGQAPPVSLADPRVHLADMNGDGLQDLVRVDGAGVSYWPYLGNGRWGQEIVMSNPLDLPPRADPQRLFLSDLDGDGCSDLVYVDVDRVTYWLNQSGVRVGDRQEIDCTPPAVEDRVRLVDMKGTGTAGLLWSDVPGGSRRARHLYLDFTGGVKPYLLSRIDNGMGLETRIRYRTSTEFALDDDDAGSPWRTFHPFPLQCVAEIELVDAVTARSSLTRHHYHAGRFDGQTRTFLGFGVVDVEMVGDDSIPTLVTHNVYHVGLDPSDPERDLTGEDRLRLGALRRRLLRTEIYGLDGSAQQGRPYEVVHHEYEARLEPATGGRSVAVPFETRTLEEQFERGPAPFAFREIRYLDIDPHGNIRLQQSRVWRAGNPQPDLEVTTEAAFAINEAAHIVSLPARVTQRGAAGEVLSAIVTHYDGPAHQGLPEGQVDVGNITRQDALAISDEGAQAIYGADQPDWLALGYRRRPGENGWWVTQVSYERRDVGGIHTLATRGPRGFESHLAYDATRQFPQRLTDAAGNVVEGVPDRRVFQMASLVDANGQETVDRFDALGRVVATIKPGDSEALPTSQYTYHSEALPVRLASFHRERHGQPETLDDYQHFDGRGEFIQRIVEGEGDPGRRFIAQDSREYTVRGQIAARYLPYYVDAPEYSRPQPNQPHVRMRYDASGRLVEQIKPSGARVTQTFHPGSIEMWDEGDNASPVPTPVTHRLDGLKRVVAVEHRLTNRTITATYEYDHLNHLVRIQDAQGGVTRLMYDLLGRILVEEAPDTGRILFVVDAGGNQVRRTTATGKTVFMTHDELNRLVEVREAGAASPEIAYTYLDSGDPAPADGVRNRRGRAWQIQDRLGRFTYAYDALGQVEQTRRGVDALGGRELVTDWRRDAQGRIRQIVHPELTPGAGRRVVDYRYNRRGLPEAAPGYVRSAAYDVQGHMTRLLYQNNVENLLDFDPLTSRPHRLRVVGPGGAILRDQAFGYDAVGNLLHIDSPLPVEAGRFVYDDLCSLVEATYDSGEHYAYAYGDGGNITWSADAGNYTYGGPAASGAVTAAGGSVYTYDADGHLQSAPYGHLHFDALDNLVGVDLTDGRHMQFLYDYQGRRVIRRVIGGSETIFASPHTEFHDGQPVEWVLFGGKRILGLSGGASVFVHADLQGTPTLYTSGNGSEVRRLAFGPYGTLRYDSAAGTAMPGAVRFTGQPYDDETGLICLGRRFYDPRLGRFISPDRVVPGIYRLDAWNRYVYGHNNPLRYADPTGRFGWGDFFAALGIAIVVAALIVAGVFTAGATWAVAGVTISVSGLLYGTAAGVAAGAIVGGISAGMAGGDIWAGILFGGFVGGVASFAGGTLGALAGGAVGSLVPSGIGIYLAGGVGGAVQGALVGAGTGLAMGFAGGKGTAESMWTHLWKGAVIGAITGALLGLASAYLQNTPNATLRVGTLENINPQVPANGGLQAQASYLDSSASLGQGIARAATGLGGSGGVGTFVGIGSGSGSSLLSIPLDWVPAFLGQYGGMELMTSLVIGVDKFTELDFADMLVLALELAPYFVGIFFTIADDAGWDWFEDMESAFHDAFSLPEPA